MTQTHGPCVCVQNIREKDRRQEPPQEKPQDGGVCVLSYTMKQAVLLFCCCFVVSQSNVSMCNVSYVLTSNLTSLMERQYE